MSAGKGMAPRKGYNHQKYAENYDQIFRPMKTNQETKPMTPDQPTATATPRTDDEIFESLWYSQPFFGEHESAMELARKRFHITVAHFRDRELAEAKAEVAGLKAHEGDLVIGAAILEGARQQEAREVDQLRARVAELEQDKNTCHAVIWIHSHHQTGEPLQIDVVEWRGRIDVLNQLTDDSKIGELDLSAFKCEEWLNVRVEYSHEEDGYSLKLFHRAAIDAAKGQP